MNLKHLTVFHTVARLKSFGEAVSVTQLSQPTVSRIIKQLEDHMGVELIDRYHRPLQLTAEGAFFYEKIDQILKDLSSTITLTQRMANPPDTLNIGFVPSVLYGLLPTVISRLKQRLPTLEVQLKDINSFNQVESIKSGEIDIGFGRFAHDDVHINQVLLRHERYVVALSKDHPLANAFDINLAALQDSKLILYHQTHLPVNKIPTSNSEVSPSYSEISEPLLNIFDKQSALPYQTTQVSDIQIALGLVAAGEGITLVPDSLKTLRSDQVNYCSLIHEDATSPIFVCSLLDHVHPAYPTILEVIYEIYEERGITYRPSN